MPVLLDPATAPSLTALLAEVFTDGLDWEIQGPDVPVIAGIGALSSAGPSEISFLVGAQYADQLAQTRAAAVILPPKDSGLAADAGFTRVLCRDPYLMYARVAQWFDARLRPTSAPGVHPSAVVAHDVEIGEGAHIGAQVVIESGARIGARCVVSAGCHVGAGSVIGEDCLLHPRVTIYGNVLIGARAIIHSGAVLGADGFGFAPDSIAASQGEPGRWVKIPQLGGVVVGDDVEIGANTTVDRGALDDTVIGNGVKLDNQIMLGHNVRVGDHTAMAGCVGIAGSTSIGQRCTLGGAAMISGHLVLGDDVHISGGSVVAASLEKPGRYTGIYPLSDHVDWQRNAAVVHQLGRLRRRIQALERADDTD